MLVSNQIYNGAAYLGIFGSYLLGKRAVLEFVFLCEFAQIQILVFDYLQDAVFNG